MGLLFGPVLENCFMNNREDTVLRPNTENFHLYRRHMDETFIFYYENSDLNFILNKFSDCRQSIKFTLESESNSKFRFLDILFTRRQHGTL